jgi:hypothetical protein
MTTRSLDQLKEWSILARERSDLVQLAREHSPSLAYNRALKLTDGNEDLAKATRWLAIIRRDHGLDALNSWVIYI